MALEYPDNLSYFETHEYALLEGDTVTVGITAYAVDQLGDIVFLELPEVGEQVDKQEQFGTVESVKAVEDLVSPVTGKVVARNDALLDAPEKLGEDPYEEGWMIKVAIDDPSELDDALSSEDYSNKVEGDDDETEDDDD
ncbi:MAG: glycine cleavage system protein GcvH [Leptolyngbyaceae bacterium]|nr:glycine cleavage system protein GcvH [Leptolyngbyaceae bacterium]